MLTLHSIHNSRQQTSFVPETTKKPSFGTLQTADLLNIAKFLPIKEKAAFSCINKSCLFLSRLYENPMWEHTAIMFNCPVQAVRMLGCKQAVKVIYTKLVADWKIEQQQKKEAQQKQDFYLETMAWIKIGVTLPQGQEYLKFMREQGLPVNVQAQKIYNAFLQLDTVNFSQTVNFSNLDLHRIPQKIKITWVRELNLSHNHLTSLPLTLIGTPPGPPGFPPKHLGLQRLTELNLEHNDFVEVPDLSNLPQLQVLKLGHNQLTQLPASFAKMKTLTSLDLSSNPLGMVPAPVLKLKQLQHLKLNFTELTSVPKQKQLGNWKELITLEIAGNKLGKNFPAQLSTLKKLVYLCFAQNNFETYNPKTLAWLKTITKVVDADFSQHEKKAESKKSTDKALIKQ